LTLPSTAYVLYRWSLYPLLLCLAYPASQLHNFVFGYTWISQLHNFVFGYTPVYNVCILELTSMVVLDSRGGSFMQGRVQGVRTPLLTQNIHFFPSSTSLKMPGNRIWGHLISKKFWGRAGVRRVGRKFLFMPPFCSPINEADVVQF
jgi:hypothetical protein